MLQLGFGMVAAAIFSSFANFLIYLMFLLKKCVPNRVNLTISYISAAVYGISGVIGLARWSDLLFDKLKMSNCSLTGSTTAVLIGNTVLSAIIMLISVVMFVLVCRCWLLFNE